MTDNCLAWHLEAPGGPEGGRSAGPVKSHDRTREGRAAQREFWKPAILRI